MVVTDDHGEARTLRNCSRCGRWRCPEAAFQSPHDRECAECRSCEGCGGEKPAGSGRRVCAACRERREAERVAAVLDATRKPCARCGSEKPRGKARRLCDSCEPLDRRLEDGTKACRNCGAPGKYARRAHYCADCRELKDWERDRKRSARYAKTRLPCRGCGRSKGPGRKHYCDACRRGRELQRRTRTCRGEGCTATVTEKGRRLCPACREAGRLRTLQRSREWEAELRRDPVRSALRKRQFAAARVRAAERARRERRERARHRPVVPAAPMAAALLRAAARREDVFLSSEPTATARGGVQLLCEDLGLQQRVMRRWTAGETDVMALDRADELLLRLGLLWFDVWNEDTLRRPALVAVRYRLQDKAGVRRRVRCGSRSYGDLGPHREALEATRIAFEGR